MQFSLKPLKTLRPARRNPKLHALDDIIESITTYGFKEVVLVNEATGRIVHGHGRLEALQAIHAAGEQPPDDIEIMNGEWMVPTVSGKFDSEEAAESYGLTVNKLVEKGGWDVNLLDAMVRELVPVGFDAIAELNHAVEEAKAKAPNVDDILQTTRKSGLMPTVGDVEGVAKVDSTGLKSDETQYRCAFDDIPGHLQGVFQLEEGHIFSSTNKYGIPDLLPDMILSEIPQPLKTWGGIKETPDDGTSYWFYNFGSTPSKGVPYERSLCSFFTTDDHVKTFLETPAYRVGKFLQAKIHAVVVPDVSLWEGNPLAVHIYSVYQAQWLGRFMQEAGLKVIPRFEYFLPEIQEFSLAGIPNKPPTLAVQLHTKIADENIPWLQKCLVEGLRELLPGQLLVYASEKGMQVISDIENELPVGELIIVPTAKKVRRPESRAELDPYLKELRKRKRGWEGKNGND